MDYAVWNYCARIAFHLIEILMFKNTPPRVNERSPGPATLTRYPAEPDTQGLSQDDLNEVRQAVVQTYLEVLLLSAPQTARSIHDMLSSLLMSARFYQLFGRDVDGVTWWEIHLFDKDSSNNDDKLDFFFRFTTRLLAAWGGTSTTRYQSLLSLVASALSSEATLTTVAQLPDNYLPTSYLEKMSDFGTVKTVLEQNRILFAIALYLLYADHRSITDALATHFNPDALGARKPRAAFPSSEPTT